MIKSKKQVEIRISGYNLGKLYVHNLDLNIVDIPNNAVWRAFVEKYVCDSSHNISKMSERVRSVLLIKRSASNKTNLDTEELFKGLNYGIDDIMVKPSRTSIIRKNKKEKQGLKANGTISI